MREKASLKRPLFSKASGTLQALACNDGRSYDPMYAQLYACQLRTFYSAGARARRTQASAAKRWRLPGDGEYVLCARFGLALKWWVQGILRRERYTSRFRTS